MADLTTAWISQSEANRIRALFAAGHGVFEDYGMADHPFSKGFDHKIRVSRRVAQLFSFNGPRSPDIASWCELSRVIILIRRTEEDPRRVADLTAVNGEIHSFWRSGPPLNTANRAFIGALEARRDAIVQRTDYLSRSIMCFRTEGEALAFRLRWM